MKSEPAVYPWSQLVRERSTPWNGVRNYLANNHMKTMHLNDKAFFYHSNEQRAIVGIMKVIKRWHQDPDDEKGRFGMVGMAPIKGFDRPVTLAEIKAHPILSQMVFVRQGRLSVSPVAALEWQLITKLGCNPR